MILQHKPPYIYKYTFDDVLLVPQASHILPKDVDLSSRITNKIKINIPLLSAAMDTVTESEMAVALAREGGMGVIHKNLSISDQVTMVDKVKRSESGMIMNPLIMDPGKTIRKAKEMMDYYHISGLPVVDDGKLIGIITNRDIRFETNLDLLVSDRMTTDNLVTVPVGTTLDKAKQILQEHRIEKLLVVDEDGSLAGLITVKDIQKKEQFPHACKDKNGRLRVAAAIGVNDEALERAQALHKSGLDALVVDTAHGHSSGVLKLIEKLKVNIGSMALIAGNIATKEGVKSLIDAGVDCPKIGIGAGASCTTRVVAGVGVPQLSAIIDCAEEAAKSDIPIIADGGVRYSGDIAKSIAAGASSVMLGSLLAGMDESPGETILFEGRQYKSYRGMGSLGAMKEGSGDRYFQEGAESTKLVPEGIEGMVPYRGPVRNTIHQLIGGLRASMGYCGADTISNFSNNSKFIQITSAGVKEGHPHEVKVIKEAPNYQISDE